MSKTPLSAESCLLLHRDLPDAVDLHAAMAIIEAVRQELLGDGLLTVNLNVTPADAPPDVIELQRAWSSRPREYPVPGGKRKTMTAWTRQLLQRGEMFTGEGEAALKNVFDDSSLILSMGLKSVVNMPIVQRDGNCLATFNVLGTRPEWQSQEVVLIQLLAALAAPAIIRRAALGG